ncbi:hypothetical protein PybrP1_012445 [[Pythium] brassicae (nom. inval.)]|nr:hypothetical protein PybrP1_012445 [[Pythium] brassicae (nom. inval.)]
MATLDGTVIYTLAKSLVKVVKLRSKIAPGLNVVSYSLDQGQYRVTIKDLPEDQTQAMEKGADLIGELLVFSVAVVAVASYESTCSSAKSKESERRAEKLKRKAEQLPCAREDLCTIGCNGVLVQSN